MRIDSSKGSNRLGALDGKRKHSRLPTRSVIDFYVCYMMSKVEEKKTVSVCYTPLSKPCSMELDTYLFIKSNVQ